MHLVGFTVEIGDNQLHTSNFEKSILYSILPQNCPSLGSYSVEAL